MTTEFQARQGDVFIKSINEDISKLALEKVPEDELRGIVLAYGEVTGHAHAIKNVNVTYFKDKNTGKFYLMVLQPAQLNHEEHSTIDLPIGNYEVKTQRQYLWGTNVKVAD